MQAEGAILAGLRRPGDTRWHLTAWKRWLRWECEEFKRHKSRPSRPDVYVPSDEEIRQALESSLGFFYRVLV